jgi:DNA-binding NarL/FixJ family response regulator
MKTVLIIDDDPEYHELLTEAIRAAFDGVVCNCEADFVKGVDRVAIERPDAVILDLMEGLQSPNLPGAKTWRSIWDGSFCPIVIYSGTDADIEPAIRHGQRFVTRIAKGDGSLPKVVASLQSFAPFAESVRSLRVEVDAVIHKVLRDTAGDGHMPMDDAAHLLHAGRRRIAASMDDPTLIGNRKMMSWEVYLVPAVGQDCLTGDILFKQGCSRSAPESYRLMLSPSCDLARGGKIPAALVAKCFPSAAMLDKFKKAVEPTDDKDLKKQLTSLALSQGTWNGWLPLPAFADILPASAANLKDLELIPIASIGAIDSSTHEFVRVASIDSPFREQVAWAYLTTAARPGMPDRDLKSWAEELVMAATPAATAPPQAGNAAAGA